MEQIRMYLNIGDQRIALSVPRDRQDFVRATERGTDELYRKWRKQFPGKSDQEIMAMVAYQYASFYGELKERYEAASELAAKCMQLLEPEQVNKKSTESDEDDYE
ncbi:MAG: cell division protein ZapA [Muribaculaceae bacterium]|nr:cell division protein ZapA [Muribaculaceae bacterium]